MQDRHAPEVDAVTTGDHRPEQSGGQPDFWLAAFVVVGIGLRLVRYAMNMPIWGDEATLGMNIVTRSYSELLRPLDDTQVAPIGFLWAERAMYSRFGMSEYSMRLLPAVSGMATVPMFALWARRMVGTRAALIATAILAVGNYSVRYAVELKPYGFDLFATLLILLPATLFITRGQSRWLVCLIVLAPLACALSFPVVFVAGGIALGLLASAPRMRREALTLSVVYGVVLIAAFLLITWRVGGAQYQHVVVGMTSHWAAAFPPANPLRFLWWAIVIHTGNLFEYPFGGRNGGSTGSFLLFLVGVCAWLKTDTRPSLHWLLFAPFALNLAAAALRLYPYGESARVAQPLAPAIILMIGIGVAALIETAKTAPGHVRAERIVLGFLLLFGAGVMGYTVMHPYYRPEYAEVRRTIRRLFADAGPEATIAVLQPQASDGTFRWYLREHDAQIVWDAESHPGWHARGDVRVLTLQPLPGLENRLRQEMGREPAGHEVRFVPMDYLPRPGIYWEVFAFRPGSPTLDPRR